MTTNSSSDECFGLGIVDVQPHHRCFNWTETRAECEAEWPCEVRQYLVTLSPFINLTNGILSYGTVAIIIVGLFLNSLSFYTLVSSGLAKNGSGIYLVSLAVCDIGNLITNYAVGVARGNIPHFNAYFMEIEWLCRFHGVFVEVFQLISAWIVVSFTVERCIAVWYPIILRNTSRTRRAKTAIISLSTILTLFSLSKLFLTGFESDSVFGYPPCPSKRHRWQGMAYLRVAFQTWIPTIVVFVFNCLMFHKLRRIKKKRKRLTEYKRPPPSRDQNRRNSSFMNRPSPTAPMLVAVSVTYLILVFPLGAVQSVELFWNVQRKVPVFGMANLELRHQYIHWKTTKLLLKYIRSFFFGFYQINFAINFFLYFAAGLQFRLHLQHKVKGACKRWSICYFCAFCCEEEQEDQSVGTSQRTTSTSAVSSSRARPVPSANPSASNITNCEAQTKPTMAQVFCQSAATNPPTSSITTPTESDVYNEADDISVCDQQTCSSSEIRLATQSESIPLETLSSQDPKKSNVVVRRKSLDVHKSECDNPQVDTG
ncbi:Rhodopsin, GQ-coupled [Orchesella cincta]|uniref:Rhodopsin, GQ-coupled n=1 Tax=Orchesella cincta TaxID=48709 RepID=A0A1D2NBP0_ORCCI|nr:Rhodopsin, GQ-coupled [Orchesella cincta]